MAMNERFIIGKNLDVPTQLNVARRLSRAIPLVDPIVRSDNRDKDKKILVVMLLGQLTDADSDYVVNKCLSCASVRQSDGSLAKLQTKDGVLMFDDVTMNDICDIVAEVIIENLGDFMTTALSGLT